MCRAGRLLADFEVGTCRRPDVPDAVAPSLTLTVDGDWLVWAHKVALPAGDHFRPLTGGNPYPVDAVAECRCGERHSAPQPGCTCGFHAVSSPWSEFLPPGPVALQVALSGRTLAFEWIGDHVLFRAERQTVVRVSKVPAEEPPDDPSGQLSLHRPLTPTGDGPIRLRIPRSRPARVPIRDDAGYCSLVMSNEQPADTTLVMASMM